MGWQEERSQVVCHGQSPSEIRESLGAAGGQKLLLQIPALGLFPPPFLPKSPLGQHTHRNWISRHKPPSRLAEMK